MVVILPDGGRSYLSKIFSDAWMRQYGFLERDAELRVGDVLARKREAGEVPTLVSVRTDYRVRDAVALLHEHRVSQLPVVSVARPATPSWARSASADCSSTRRGIPRCWTRRSRT